MLIYLLALLHAAYSVKGKQRENSMITICHMTIGCFSNELLVYCYESVWVINANKNKKNPKGSFHFH